MVIMIHIAKAEKCLSQEQSWAQVKPGRGTKCFETWSFIVASLKGRKFISKQPTGTHVQ